MFFVIFCFYFPVFIFIFLFFVVPIIFHSCAILVRFPLVFHSPTFSRSFFSIFSFILGMGTEMRGAVDTLEEAAGVVGGGEAADCPAKTAPPENTG